MPEFMPSGVSANPGEVYSLKSRCVCCKCWIEPEIKDAGKIERDQFPRQITAVCHGEEETKTVTWESLVHTQKFFEGQEE